MSEPSLSSDLTKQITVMVVARWIMGGSFSDPTWMVLSSYTLIGYITYHMLSPIILTDPRTADIVKIAIVLLVTGPRRDPTQAASILIGYGLYNWILYDYFQVVNNRRIQGAINDIGKALSVQLIGGTRVDDIPRMLGYLAYNMILSR